MAQAPATQEKGSGREVLVTETETVYKIDISAPGAEGTGRSFFVLLDGTWNEERGKGTNFAPSNVRKLYDSLQADSPTQIARYFRGVGSAQDNGLLKRWWYGFTGEDERRIRESARATINREFRPGDGLFILGFSRGAACARRLANDLATDGIYETIRIRTQMVANRVTDQVESRFVGFRCEGEKVQVNVAFLGCWDTVGAFVLPLRFPNNPWLDWIVRKWTSLGESLKGNVAFRDLTVAPNVKRAVHCVAIDETRNAFLPTLMNTDPRVEEVWFPGVHADVGGGYVNDGLARVTLRFMVKRLDEWVKAAKLRPIEWRNDELKRVRSLEPDQKYHVHFHGLTRGFQLYGKSVRRIRAMSGNHPDHNVKPRVHWNVAELWQSDSVFAEDQRQTDAWRIDYRPFNVHELNQIYGHLRADIESDWPFEWVERPSGAYV
jgi:hypothetical protein